MKQITPIILFLVLAACGRETSPEGRAEIRREKVQKRLDSLLVQNRAILDSIHNIKNEIRNLKKK